MTEKPDSQDRVSNVGIRGRSAATRQELPPTCTCVGWRGWFRVGPYLFCDRCRRAKP